ncbi:hypothetical protein ACFWUP_07770 [Nocardia sp. NPDC058658]|uniref:hypothetical protein n=1 Tax=Nocardia sp. NPDC058658 TaxID=3346580 RepID=UPI0036479C41
MTPDSSPLSPTSTAPDNAQDCRSARDDVRLVDHRNAHRQARRDGPPLGGVATNRVHVLDVIESSKAGLPGVHRRPSTPPGNAPREPGAGDYRFAAS